jgi:predicted amidophosphoribosyltransferase
VDAIVMPCGHLICWSCRRSWFKQHVECPYCREGFAKCRQFVSYG